jgi:hypothetical protein
MLHSETLPHYQIRESVGPAPASEAFDEHPRR